ncbi:ATP-binding protein [Streptomyces tateyamensis]|uniref:ATP-binding protein n=1 Tax=Streptomyces tateyamensis TaxID=565073 RepID=A0A2V4NUP5_9ACTN|nr:ATP-binding protein [Streptomyces tateyamensis]PYC69037.1 ATP-binding protein [Streptomyces tateyamensis]
MNTSRGALDREPAVRSLVLPPGGQRRSLRLAGLPKPVARAREFTGTALADWAWPTSDQGRDIVLLVAELVANALLHANGPLELVLDARPGRLRVEVSDGSAVMPEPRLPHRPGVPGGHGLFIVQQTADHWGAEPYGTGKRVWAEITPLVDPSP